MDYLKGGCTVFFDSAAIFKGVVQAGDSDCHIGGADEACDEVKTKADFIEWQNGFANNADAMKERMRNFFTPL